MEFRFPGFDVQRHYTLRSSSNYTYIPGGHATNDGGGTFIGDQLMEIHREIDKEQIREEIIAAEIERQIALESEVRREYGIKETTTNKPKDGNTGIIGLGKQSGATVPGSNWEAGLSPSGGDSNASKKKITEESNSMVCGVSATSERGLSEHLSGIKHQAQIQASKAYNNNDADVGSGKIKNQSSKTENSCKSGGTLSGSKQEAGLSPSPPAVLGLSGVSSNTSKKKTEEWICIVCGIHATSECMLSEHLSGKKHQAQMEAQKEDNDGTDIGFGKIKKRSSKTENSCKSGATMSASKEDAGVLPSTAPVLSSKTSKKKIEERNWVVCGIHTTSEHMLSEHLSGKKHQAQMEATKADSKGANIGIGKIKKQSSKPENSCKSDAPVSGSKDEAGASPSPPFVLSSSGVSAETSKKKIKGKPSGATVYGSNWEAGPSLSLPAVLGSSGGDSNTSKKKITEEWNCMVCGVSATSERGLSEHLSGIKHQAQIQASKAYNNNDVDVGSGKIKKQSSKTENSCKLGGTLSGSKQEAGLSPSPPAVLGLSGVGLNTSKMKTEEWNCIVCGIHATSECMLSEHLSGKKHQAQMEAPKANNDGIDIGFEKIKKQSSKTKNSCKSGATVSGLKGEAGVSPSPPAVLGSETSKKKIKEEWNCIVCGIHATSKRMLSEHLSSKKHQAQMEAPKADNNGANIGIGKIKKQSSKTEHSCKSGATVSCSKGEAGGLPSPPAVLSSSGVSAKTSKKKIKVQWNCHFCGIHATSEHMLNEHLSGKKHQAQVEAPKDYNSPDIGSGKIKIQSSSTENSCKSGVTMPDSEQESGVSSSPIAVLGSSGVSSNTSKKNIKEWNCIICGIHATSEHMLRAHLSGKKHQAQMEALKAYDNNDDNVGFDKIKKHPNTESSCKSGATLSGSQSEAGVSPLSPAGPGSCGGNSNTSKKKIKEEWNCMVCGVSVTSERGLSEHLSGKKHQAQMEAPKSCNNDGADIGSGKIKKQSPNTENLCKSGATMSGSKREAGLSPSPLADLGSSGGSSNTSKKKIKEEWNCMVSGVGVTSERGLSEHLSGKRHQAQLEASKARDNNGADIVSGKINKQPSNTENLCKSVPIDLKEDKKITDENTNKKFRYWCSMCQAGAQDEKIMSSHKNGKKHMKNLLKMEGEKSKVTDRESI